MGKAGDEEVQAAYDEAAADLDKLMGVARKLLEDYGPTLGAVGFTTAVLAEPRWNDAMMLGSVLGVAVMKLAEVERG